jgi:hypothetical protein
MKNKLWIIVLLFLTDSGIAFAQSNPDEYRNLAAMHLWMQNCDKAQKCYAVYKDVSGKQEEKMNVLIAALCQGKSLDNYAVVFNWQVLQHYLENASFSDKELILRILNMYSEPEGKAQALRKFENVYESIARSMDGAAWYDAIEVKKKL